jgi:hypothetical protein
MTITVTIRNADGTLGGAATTQYASVVVNDALEAGLSALQAALVAAGYHPDNVRDAITEWREA